MLSPISANVGRIPTVPAERLFQRAAELAAEDLRARKSGNSLLQDKAVANNILITGYRLPEVVGDRIAVFVNDHLAQR